MDCFGLFKLYFVCFHYPLRGFASKRGDVMLLPNLAMHCTNIRTWMLEHEAGQ